MDEKIALLFRLDKVTGSGGCDLRGWIAAVAACLIFSSESPFTVLVLGD